ncbi:MAG TPA: hypothetical protein VFU62_11005 [Hanamia sp.]|nr:hypothetical protein [Hanamia sp.]
MKKLTKRFSNWQHWPFLPFYLPVSFMWLWYCIRSGSLWFFSTSNPTLTFGGFEGESKDEMYNLLSQEFYPKTIYIKPKNTFEQVCEDVKERAFSYPLIVKPNVGMAGILFRKIDNESQLEIYHHLMPVDYIIQDFVDYPFEVSVFYHRHPENKTGKVSAFFSKKLPCIKGDGISSIEELVKDNKPAIKEELNKLSGEKLQTILAKDEVFYLSFIGNRYHGTTFHDLSDLIDHNLLKVFDKISFTNDFFYGRYDIKCQSIDDLKNGKNFSILEFNGAGSIPNHIYTEKYHLKEAYHEILKHWKALYEISNYNHKNGLPYWGFAKGLFFLLNAKKHFRFLKKRDVIIERKMKSIKEKSGTTN